MRSVRRLEKNYTRSWRIVTILAIRQDRTVTFVVLALRYILSMFSIRLEEAHASGLPSPDKFTLKRPKSIRSS